VFLYSKKFTDAESTLSSKPTQRSLSWWTAILSLQLQTFTRWLAEALVLKEFPVQR
jgi:hypothetical protein